jgi:hypothetical protein
MLIGFGIFAIYHFSTHSLVQETASNTSYEITLDKNTDESLVEKPKIIPCSNRDSNSFKHEPEYQSSRISIGFANSRVLCGELPEYPKNLKDRKISGLIKVHITINHFGEVIAANAYDGNKLLGKYAQRAAYKTKFAPILIQGKAHNATGVLVYVFDNENGVKLQDAK